MGAHGIRVNAVGPGVTRTPMLADGGLASHSPIDSYGQVQRLLPVARRIRRLAYRAPGETRPEVLCPRSTQGL